MDAGQDVWDWEVLQPDQMSSSMCQDGTNLAGKNHHQFVICMILIMICAVNWI